MTRRQLHMMQCEIIRLETDRAAMAVNIAAMDRCAANLSERIASLKLKRGEAKLIFKAECLMRKQAEA